MVFYIVHAISSLGNAVNEHVYPFNGWLFLYTLAHLVPEYNVSNGGVRSLIGIVQLVGLFSFGVYLLLFFWRYNGWKELTKKEEDEDNGVRVKKINKPREVITR